MKKKIDLNKDDLNSLAIPAMRYALGRKSYTICLVCHALINNSKNLRTDVLKLMAKEIDNAIQNNEAGMDIDARAWTKVLTNFVLELEGRDKI